MSFEDGLCWGFNSDWDALPDLHDLVEALLVAYDELQAVASTKT